MTSSINTSSTSTLPSWQESKNKMRNVLMLYMLTSNRTIHTGIDVMNDNADSIDRLNRELENCHYVPLKLHGSDDKVNNRLIRENQTANQIISNRIALLTQRVNSQTQRGKAQMASVNSSVSGLQETIQVIARAQQTDRDITQAMVNHSGR